MRVFVSWLCLFTWCVLVMSLPVPIVAQDAQTDLEIRKGLSELHAELGAARVELKNVIEAEKRRSGKLRSAIGGTEQRLSGAQVRTQKLIAAQDRTEQRVAAQGVLTDSLLQQRAQLIRERATLARERDSLIAVRSRSGKVIAEHVTIANELTQERDKLFRERDALLLKIKKSNGRWNCDIFGVGCLK